MYVVCRLELERDADGADAPASAALRPDADEVSHAMWVDPRAFLDGAGGGGAPQRDGGRFDHPLIRAVLKRLYGADAPGAGPDGEGGGRALPPTARPPRLEIVEAGVGWPNREPYPTYFPCEIDE